MEKKYSDEKAVELIFESLQKLKRGETSFEAFAVGVALVIDFVPLTEKDFEWARKTARSLGLERLLTPRAADGSNVPQIGSLEQQENINKKVAE